MKNLKVTLLILPLLMAVPALAQNSGYTDYFTYSVTYNSDGSATVTPTAEVTGTDDLSDWQENGYRPLCSLTPKIQLTGDSNWIPGYGAALGQTVDFVHTGQPIQVPADGSDESIQFSVEVLAHCAGAVGFYEYPAVGSLDSWSGIDPYDWFLEGFEPGQTDPPSYIQYCPDGDACQVGEWEVPPTNFVDFADFLGGKVAISIGNFVNSGPGGLYPDGCLFKLSCPNGTASRCAPPSISGKSVDCPYTYDHEYYLAWIPDNGAPDCFFLQLGNGSEEPVNCQ